MSKRDSDLKRLLHAAAEAMADEPVQAPFGFDTRVVAQWRAQRSESFGDSLNLARLCRRVTLGAIIVAACASAGAFWEFKENDDLDGSAANAYAMADSVIEAGAWQ